MRRLDLILSIAISTLLLTGCNPVPTMVDYQLDSRLPRLNNIKAIADNTAIGLEWQPVASKGLDGVNIYRTEANTYANSAIKQLVKIATISNPFASHYVDTNLQQNSIYTYTFTTIKGGFESPHGKILEIKTLPPLEKVTFFQGSQKSANSIKLLWRPHSNKKVKMYRVERSVNNQEWVWIDSVNNRMMSEYIDNYIQKGNRYQYRIIAVGFDGSYSYPSSIVSILAK